MKVVAADIKAIPRPLCLVLGGGRQGGDGGTIQVRVRTHRHNTHRNRHEAVKAQVAMAVLTLDTSFEIPRRVQAYRASVETLHRQADARLPILALKEDKEVVAANVPEESRYA